MPKSKLTDYGMVFSHFPITRMPIKNGSSDNSLAKDIGSFSSTDSLFYFESMRKKRKSLWLRSNFKGGTSD